MMASSVLINLAKRSSNSRWTSKRRDVNSMWWKPWKSINGLQGNMSVERNITHQTFHRSLLGHMYQRHTSYEMQVTFAETKNLINKQTNRQTDRQCCTTVIYDQVDLWIIWLTLNFIFVIILSKAMKSLCNKLFYSLVKNKWCWQDDHVLPWNSLMQLKDNEH